MEESVFGEAVGSTPNAKRVASTSTSSLSAVKLPAKQIAKLITMATPSWICVQPASIGEGEEEGLGGTKHNKEEAKQKAHQQLEKD